MKKELKGYLKRPMHPFNTDSKGCRGHIVSFCSYKMGAKWQRCLYLNDEGTQNEGPKHNVSARG